MKENKLYWFHHTAYSRHRISFVVISPFENELDRGGLGEGGGGYLVQVIVVQSEQDIIRQY